VFLARKEAITQLSLIYVVPLKVRRETVSRIEKALIQSPERDSREGPIEITAAPAGTLSVVKRTVATIAVKQFFMKTQQHQRKITMRMANSGLENPALGFRERKAPAQPTGTNCTITGGRLKDN
jgi:hypothetical protein